MKRINLSFTKRITLLTTCLCLVVLHFVSPHQTVKAQTTPVRAKVLHAITNGFPPFWWSSDDKTLAFHNGNIFLYDTGTGQIRTEIKYESKQLPPAIYFTGDSNEIIVQSDRLQVYNATDGKLLRQFAESTFQINTDGQPAAGYSADDESSSSSQILWGLVIPSTSARPTSPDGNFILVGAKAGKAQVYDLRTGELRFTLEPFVAPGKKHSGYDYARGEFSADGRFIATANGNKTPRLWNAATGELIANLAPQTGDAYQATLSVDSKLVLTPGYDGIVRIWDASTGKLLHVIGSKQDRNFFVGWNPVNNSFVAKTRREVNIWNAETGQLICKLDKNATKEKFDDNGIFAYSPDGRILATPAKNENTLGSMLARAVSKGKPRLIAHLWDTATGSLIGSWRDTKPRDAYAYQFDKYFWSPTSNFLVIAGPSVRIWNTRGEFIQELAGNAAIGASLSPNGKFLVIKGAKPETLGDTLVMTGKIMIGKLPKDEPEQTYVWQIVE